MTDYVIPTPITASLPISTGAQRFPIRRVFCVGRNYEAHAKEMGVAVDRRRSRLPDDRHCSQG